jgi:hypothetical protein
MVLLSIQVDWLFVVGSESRCRISPGRLSCRPLAGRAAALWAPVSAGAGGPR